MTILVAGIGNILMGDDGFGVEVVRRLAARPRSANVEIADFGIRGFDLALALSTGHSAAILIDAGARNKDPGTLTVLEPHEIDTSTFESHGMHPLRALGLARSLGGLPPHIRVLVCEPETLGTEDEPVMGLSESVERAVSEALAIVDGLIAEAAHA
jgi:hydrogenase maturation protease